MTIRRWLGACAAVAVLAWPGAAAAQQQSPEEVAQAYFAHFRAGEVDRVAALMHPRALESFRTSLLQMFDPEDMDESPLAEVGDIETMSAQELFVSLMSVASEDSDLTGVLGTLEVQPLGHVPQGDSLAHVVYAARLAFMNQPSQQTMVLSLRRGPGGWRVDPGDGLVNVLGGGMMPLLMAAGMQAGMVEALAGDDDEEDDEDDESEDDGDDEDEDSEDDPPSP
jgi:hypothetical protein